MIRSRNPGANRSIWAMIASVASPENPFGTWAYVHTGCTLPTERCGSARYCCPTNTNGRSGMRPAWISRSVAASSVKLPTTCTVPARRAAGLIHGTPPSTAKSTLKAPGPCLNRRKAPAIRRGRRSPRMRATASGARSNIVTSAGGNCEAVSIRVPVSILPPRSESSAANALVIDCEPPAATGHPWRCHGVVQRPKGVRRNASEQCPSFRAAKPPGQGGCGQCGGGAEAGQRQRMMRHPQQRTHDVLGQRIETGRRLAEQAAPPGTIGAQPVGRGLDRAVQHARATPVERVDAVNFRQAPRQAVTIETQAGEELRADGHRMDRRAVVVQQAGNDRLAAARATPDFVGGLQNGDLEAGLGEGDPGGQAVRPGPHDDRVAHASPPTRSGPRSFLAAILTRARLRVLMPRLPLAPVLARSLLRSSLALGFGCSCLASHSLRSSLVPCCGPHSRSASGAHASPPTRSGPRSFLAAVLTRARLRVLMPRLPLAPVLARSLLRSSLALGFGCSCLASRPLRSSLVPCCDPHSRSASGAHASPPARCGPRSFLAAILTRARLRVLMPRLPLAAVLARSLLRSSLALGFGCSCLASRSLRSSLVPCCDPHSRSASGGA